MPGSAERQHARERIGALRRREVQHSRHDRRAGRRRRRRPQGRPSTRCRSSNSRDTARGSVSCARPSRDCTPTARSLSNALAPEPVVELAAADAHGAAAVARALHAAQPATWLSTQLLLDPELRTVVLHAARRSSRLRVTARAVHRHIAPRRRAGLEQTARPSRHDLECVHRARLHLGLPQFGAQHVACARQPRLDGADRHALRIRRSRRSSVRQSRAARWPCAGRTADRAARSSTGRQLLLPEHPVRRRPVAVARQLAVRLHVFVERHLRRAVTPPPPALAIPRLVDDNAVNPGA